MGKLTLISAASVAASCLVLLANTAYANNVPTLTIEQFIGTIDIRTGDYDKITVTETDGVEVERSGTSVTIDGGQTTKNTKCKTTGSKVKIYVGKGRWNKRKAKYKNLDQYPQIKITAPENTHLIIDDVIIFGKTGNFGSGIKLRSCGDVNFADFSGHLDLRIAGSGDVNIGRASSGDIAIAGSGDFTALDMQTVTISVAGSGDVDIGNVSGSVSATIAGSGDTKINNIGGNLTYRGGGSGDLDLGDISGNAEITIGGSGSVEIGRIDGGLSYTGGGSGGLSAHYVGGTKLSVRTGGSGTTDIQDGDVTELYIKTGGSGSVRYGGQSQSAEVSTRGSANITIRKPSGSLIKEKRGSGKIRIR